ncbi:MAG: head GIN domain-containing protein [Sphingomonas sp.]
MRLLPLFALPLIAAASVAADTYDRGPGLPGERQGNATAYRVADFDKVGFGLAGEIDVRVGPAWSVRATGPAAAFANLRVTRENGSLQIGRRFEDRDNERDGNRLLERQVRFVVTLPRLSGVALGGSGRMTVDRVQGGAFNAALGGSGNLTLGTVQVDRADISIGGSGNVTATGSARSLKISLGGSGNLQAPELRAASADVSSAGSGGIRATVDGPARVSVVGNGSIDLGRGARCTVTRMGRAQVRCGS